MPSVFGWVWDGIDGGRRNANENQSECARERGRTNSRETGRTNSAERGRARERGQESTADLLAVGPGEDCPRVPEAIDVWRAHIRCPV